MSAEQIYIEQIDRLMDLQNVYFTIFIALLALFVGFVGFLQFRFSDKQIKSIRDSNEISIKRAKEANEVSIKRVEEINEAKIKGVEEKNKQLEKVLEQSNQEMEHYKRESASTKEIFKKEIETLNNQIEELGNSITGVSESNTDNKTRYTIEDLLEQGIVKAGDRLQAKNRPDEEATLQENGLVTYVRDNEEIISSINSWLKLTYDWKTVSTYDYAIYSETGQTLDELRRNLYEETIDSDDSDNKYFNINELMEHNVIQPGDKLYAKTKQSFVAELLKNGQVKYKTENKTKMSSMNAWLKEVYGWPSISTYDYAVQASSEKTLNELREELYLQQKSDEFEKGKPIKTIKDLLAHEIVHAGDILVAKNEENYKAELLSNGEVKYYSDNKEVVSSINAWLKEVYGWTSVSTYEYAVHQESGETLDKLRKNPQ